MKRATNCGLGDINYNFSNYVFFNMNISFK